MQFLTESTFRDRHGFGPRGAHGLLRETFSRFRLIIAARRDYKMLREAPDHLLKDIGLSRHDINAAEADLKRITVWPGF